MSFFKNADGMVINNDGDTQYRLVVQHRESQKETQKLLSAIDKLQEQVNTLCAVSNTQIQGIKDKNKP